MHEGHPGRHVARRPVHEEGVEGVDVDGEGSARGPEDGGYLSDLLDNVEAERPRGRGVGRPQGIRVDGDGDLDGGREAEVGQGLLYVSEGGH